METKRKRDIMNKVAWAINNCESVTEEELQKIYNDAIKFKMSLPADERGRFGWESCLEDLYMLAF